MALIVTDGNIDEILVKNQITVLDFWAEWCGPCRMLGPIIETLSAEEINNGITIGKVDVDANNASATRFGVRNIPTVIFLKDGEVVDKMVGVSSKDALQAKIDSLK